MRKLRTIEMNRLTVEQFRDAEKMPLVVVLDDVRSMYNVGSVFRTCDAFRVEAIYLCGITATPPHNEIHKTALGAEDAVAWRYFPTAEEAVKDLHDNGYRVFSIEQAEGSTKLEDLATILNPSTVLPPPFSLSPSSLHHPNSSINPPHSSLKHAIVLGNEVKGVHQEVVDASDGCIEIPQYGTKHSLNVSVTAGIVIHEFHRLTS